MKIGLIPKFNELSLFLTTLTLILILVFNRKFLIEIFGMPPGEFAHIFLAIMLLSFYGVYLSILHIFVKRNTLKSERNWMILYAILINIYVGISAGSYMLNNAKGIFFIFPLVNFFYAFLLFVLIRENMLDDNTFTNKQVKKNDVVLGLILILLIFFISNSVFNNYWAISFTLCLTYAMSFHAIINKILFKKN